jgi:Peptidase M60, enhancin and enhancin-like/N-terminal domain of M60-like peptidases
MRYLTLIAVIASVLVTACGGGGSSSATDTPTAETPAATVPETSTATTQATTTTTPTTTATTPTTTTATSAGPVTLAGATIDPATRTTIVPVLPSARAEAGVLKTNPWSDYRPTGIYAKPREVISIQVGAAPAGATLEAVLGLWNQKTGVASPVEVDPTFIPLAANSTNNVSSTYGGPVYVRAVNTTKGGTVQFKVTAGGTPMPLFLLGRGTHAEWIKAVNAPNATPYVEMVTNRAIVTFYTEQVKAVMAKDPTVDIAKIAAVYDQMIGSHDGVAGLDDSSPTSMRRVHPLHYLPHNRASYMFATSFRTAYCVDCANFLFTNDLIKDGWGPWHETGHMYQGAWEWSGLSEVSVNLYSLTFENLLGKTNRLLGESSPGVTFWGRALQRRAANTPLDKMELFEQLVMFWQLRLAYGSDFWPTLQKRYRDPATTPANNEGLDNRRQNFIVMASRAAGQDLRGYLSAWGIPPTAATDTAVKALNLPAADVTALLAVRP